MKKLALSMAVLLLAFSAAMADDAYVTFAKSLTANQYDSNLPSLRIEQWLNSQLPPDVNAVWGENVTDCGEQTGDPKIDKDRDLPLCAEIELKKKGKVIGYLLLFVGTEKKGKLKDNATLYYGDVKQRNKTIRFKRLGDIKKMKNSM